ncbi:hypothetical protein MACK_002098 [Theileria orientalis]|uniref:3'-5' exonuclease domain-containing protein n=1 Tax=Theileria orientalis TaxID=68886 RepID=A0A976MBJ2_THEOR|nr:hypothetical protein MACK_002098 [Theileria orientalis]
MDLFVDAIDSKVQPLEEYHKLVKIRKSDTNSDSKSRKKNKNDSKKSKASKSPQNLDEPSHITSADKPVANPTEKGSKDENKPIPFLNSLVDSCTDLVRTTNKVFTEENRNILSSEPNEAKLSEISKICHNSIQKVQSMVKKVAPDYVYDKGTNPLDVLLDEIKYDFKRHNIPIYDSPPPISVKRPKSDSSAKQNSDRSDKVLSQDSDRHKDRKQKLDKSDKAFSKESDKDSSVSNESSANEDSDSGIKNKKNYKGTFHKYEKEILKEYSVKIDLERYHLPPRPQDKWKDSIDNFTTLLHKNKKYKKYNKIKPQINYNKEDKEVKFFENGFVPKIYPSPEHLNTITTSKGSHSHLYLQELNSLDWSEEKLDSTHKGYNILGGKWNLLKHSKPIEVEKPEYIMVLTKDELQNMIDKIKKGTILSIDVEHHSKNTYRGFVCLIQLSTPDENFIVDPFNMFTHMNNLNRVTTDPRILKIMHGSDNDIVWLQRDFGVYIVNMFDTRQAAKILNLEGDSLLKLINKYFHMNMNKKYQLSDWSQRPLEEEMLNYACSDSYYLIPLYVRMKNDILSAKDGKIKMKRVMTNSKDLCLRQYVDKGIQMKQKFVNISRKNKIEAKTLDFVEYNFMLNLLVFRNYAARKLDVSEQMVIKDYQLSMLIKKMASTHFDIFVKKMCDFMNLVSHEIANLIKIKNTIAMVYEKLNRSELTLKEPHSIQWILKCLDKNLNKSQLAEFQKMVYF